MSVIEILKPHNLEAFREISKMIDSGMKKIAIPRATGSGKTYIMGALAEQYNDDRKLVLEPSKPLLDSIRDNFTEFGIDNTDFITYQKLAHMSDEDIAEMDYKLIFLDEFHHGTAPKWGQKIEHLMATHIDSIFCGTSATIIRGDGVNVVDSLFDGNAIDELSLSTAIARKVLPCPTYVTAIYRLNDELDKLKKKIENSTNTRDEKKEFFEKMQAMKNHFEKSYGVPTILNKYILEKSGKFLVFCKDKEHLNSMRDVVIDWFKISGVKNIHSYAVYSDYPDKEKEYKAFCEDESDSLKLLYSINMLNEGLHIDNISGVLMLRTTMSDIVYRQQLGRVLEAGNLGKHPLVLDLVNNFSSAGEGMGLLREIKDAVEREKESDPEFDYNGFEDIDTFFVLENVLEIQEMFSEIEGRLKGREWSEEENNILRKWYPIEGAKVVDRLNGRTKQAIRTQARELGLKAPNNSWTEKENNILKRWYPIEGTKVVDRLSGRTKGAIKTQARRLGLKAHDTWTEKEIEILKRWYPIEGTKVVDRLSGRTRDAIRLQARKLGLSNSIKLWTEEEIEILKKYYSLEGTKVISRLNGRTKNAIIGQAKKLGLKRKNNNKYKRAV